MRIIYLSVVENPYDTYLFIYLFKKEKYWCYSSIAHPFFDTQIEKNFLNIRFKILINLKD